MKITNQEAADRCEKIKEDVLDYTERSNPLAKLVVMEKWDSEPKGSVRFIQGNGEYKADDGVNVVTRTYSMKRRAFKSPLVNIESDEAGNLVKMAERSLRDVISQAWTHAFQRDLIALTDSRKVVRSTDEVMLIESRLLKFIYPRKINLFGRPVETFRAKKVRYGIRYEINPRYRKAAEQRIFFHPDTVHFQFLDPDNWIGEVEWVNVPDEETNPNGDTGFYKAVLTYAAKPYRTDLGMVVTILPTGIRGLLWKWIWRIFRFTP